MDRRTFLRSRSTTSQHETHNREPYSRLRQGVSGNNARISSAGLTAYTASQQAPWNERRAGHLLRRAGFGVTRAALDAALQSTPAQIVQQLLSPQPLPQPPGAWVTQQPFAVLDNNALAQYTIWARQLQEWWLQKILAPQNALREKMVLFLHNHFVSEFQVVYVAQHLYAQNQLFREYAFGNFKELTKKVTIDPAMLKYLDLGLSRAGNPNENYPRELLELFTIGEGTYSNSTPHYTEHDIVELSRALTGWTINGLGIEFKPARFDSGAKTIFGETANFGVNGVGDRDVVDLIFEQVDQDLNTKRAAVFLSSKLYQLFVYDVPDMTIVSEMAQTLEESNWNIAPVLEQLLTSEHFFDANVMGAVIKSPVDFVAGAINELGLTPALSPLQSLNQNRPETHDPITAASTLTQVLLNPPNVKGWPGGRSWISSVTVPLRIRYSEMWAAPIPGAHPYNFDPIAYIKTFPEYDDVYKVLDSLLALLLPVDVSDATQERLIAELLGGGQPYDWDPDNPSAQQRIRSCIVSITNLGEYQLN